MGGFPSEASMSSVVCGEANVPLLLEDDMRWTKAVTVAACLAAGAAFAQSSTSGTGTAPEKSTDTKSTDTKSETYKSESKSSAKDSKAAPKGTTADKDKDTSTTGTGGSSSTPDTTKK